jgi:hypothetical protein
VPPLGEKGWDRTPALRFDGSVLLFPTNLKPEEFWPHITINGGEVTPDLDDNRRPFGGGRVPVPAVGQEPVPNATPAKPEGGPDPARDLRQLEDHIVLLTALLQEDQVRADLAEAVVAKVTKAFQAGATTAEEVAKAKAAAVEASVRVAARKAELAFLQKKLDDVKKSSSPKK